MARRDRELRRTRKKEAILARHGSKKKELSIGDYINKLFSKFYYDETRIYNAKESLEILELIEDMKKSLPENQWDIVLRKAIKKTQVKEKERAFNELKSLI